MYQPFFEIEVSEPPPKKKYNKFIINSITIGVFLFILILVSNFQAFFELNLLNHS